MTLPYLAYVEATMDQQRLHKRPTEWHKQSLIRRVEWEADGRSIDSMALSNMMK